MNPLPAPEALLGAIPGMDQDLPAAWVARHPKGGAVASVKPPGFNLLIILAWSPAAQALPTLPLPHLEAAGQGSAPALLPC